MSLLKNGSAYLKSERFDPAIKESQAAVSGVLNDIQSSVESMRESTYTTSYYQKKAYQEQKFQSDILFWNTFIL